jgi:hypothetical protein
MAAKIAMNAAAALTGGKTHRCRGGKFTASRVRVAIATGMAS